MLMTEGTAPSVVTAGTFDGVHLGHRAVVGCVVEEARSRGVRPLVITFDPHPLVLVAPHKLPGLLESLDERVERISHMGATPVVVPFTRELMNTTASGWLDILRRDYGAVALVAGYDNTFGRDGRSMSVDDYVRLGKSKGLDVVKAPVIEGISSSRIRRALAAGDVVKASEMLGYPYTVEGTVVHGRELGRKLGFPTANIAVASDRMLPACGVYAADICLDSGICRRAVVNIGSAPTVSDRLPVTVEAHIIGFDGNLYGERLRLAFLERLRDERKFDSLDHLKAAIAADVMAASTLKG